MRILLFEHPFAPCAPREFEVNSLGEWLLSYYGETPKVGVQIFEGEPSAEREITGDLKAILTAKGGRYTVLQSPGEAGFWYSLITSVVLSVASRILFPPADMPANVNRTQESPNNGLSDRENQVRMLQRIEDIYGTVRSIPSLMMTSYRKYVNHQAVEVGYYCVGRGYHDISEVKDGDTYLSAITGASASVYRPFTSPNSGDSPQLQIGDPIIDDIATVRRSVEVDGYTLKALNQVQLATATPWLFVPGGLSGTYLIEWEGLSRSIYVPPSANDRIALIQGAPIPSAVVDVGDTLTIVGPGSIHYTGSGAVHTDESVPASGDFDRFVFAGTALRPNIGVGESITFSGFTETANNGTFVVTAVGPLYLQVGDALEDEDAPDVDWSFDRDTSGYSGTRDVTAVTDNIITLDSASFPAAVIGAAEQVNADVQIVGATEWTDWIILPATDRTEIWVNIIAQQGMYADAGSGKTLVTVTFDLQMEQLNEYLVPTGIVETITGTISGNVTSERAVTVEHVTGWTGQARVRMRRNTPFLYTFQGTLIDEIKWADLYSVSPVDKAHFGNLTTIHTVTQATTRATNVRQRQLNCIASRLIPTYDGSTFSGAFDEDGRIASGAIHATSKIVDIIAAVTVDPMIGRSTIDTLDMAQIWGVQQALDSWNVECGQFNYTLDSDTLSYEDTIGLIANAAFCVGYRQNGLIRLTADRPQSSARGLLSHRNKALDSETITRTFSNDSEYDGIELVYQDPETLQSETIRLPKEGNYSKLKKIEIPGIRSYTQAWFRACREYARLVNQRLTVEVKATNDARVFLPNSRINIVDNTVFKAYDGEIVGQDGLVLTLSRDVAFEVGQPHSILLMKRNGSLESIPVTEGAAANKVILQNLPSEALVTVPGDEGIRTTFSFASDSAREAEAWLVQELTVSDEDYMQVRAINYSDAYYAADSEPIPPKESVIL